MKNLHELSSQLAGKTLLPNQLNNIKGGGNSSSASAGAGSAADDDKRRERPGGGISN